MRRLLLILLCVFSFLDAYELVFQGIEDQELLKLMQSASELVSLSNHQPETVAAFRRRADDDIPNIIKALHSQAYYNAHVVAEIDFKNNIVTVKVDLGPVYLFKDFCIWINTDCKKNDESFPYKDLLMSDLNVNLDQPALPKKIIEAEEVLLKSLSRFGYPLATIEKREVLADQADNKVIVHLQVNCGPLAFFGPVSITGQSRVKDLFFYNKITWNEGDIYNPEKISRTLASLEASGLFSSINITYADHTDDLNQLPIKIQVIESRHRSIGGGLSYNTDLGIGGTAEWEHRNFRGMGERLSFKTNLWQIKQEAYFRYVKPDFIKQNQDLLLKAEVEHEVTKGFTESSMSLSGIIENRLNDNWRFSYGGVYELLQTSHSLNNRGFQLIKTPFQLFWTNVNNLLDPTLGRTMQLKMTPAYQTVSPTFIYITNLFTTTTYWPVNKDHSFVLAGKATVGSIWGSNIQNIPPSERFYAGSDNLLRGYRYMTVSPISKEDHHKPTGGRSIMVCSLEARYKATENWGLMAFWDIGNAYTNILPDFTHKQFQSVGAGVRYYTPVGPLRFDIAFPLNRRRHIDHFFQIYVSIGQAF